MTTMIQFNVDFLGTTVVDKRFTNPMVPWVIADIIRRKHVQKIKLTISHGEFIGEHDDVLLFHHELNSTTQNLHKFCLEPNNARIFMHLVRDKFEPVLNVYLFQATEYEDVMEIFQAIRENIKETPTITRSQSSTATLTSLCPDISPTNAQFFEVLYVGKMWVSHRIVPETFIDDALEKFHLERIKKQSVQNTETAENGKTADSSDKENSKTLSNNSIAGVADERKTDDVNKEGSKKVLETLTENSNARTGRQTFSESAKNPDFQGKENVSENSSAVLSVVGKSKSDAQSEETKNEMKYKMTRSGSLGVLESLKKKGDDMNQNRTMLLYLGRTDLRLISPDRKKVLLHKMLREINCCIQGIQHNQHFGIISREMDGYSGYVFKCESNSVADHIVSAITQAFQVIKEAKERPKQPIVSCDHCPMVWFHKLCAEIEDENDKKRQLTILKKIETLPEHEQTDIHTKFLGAESSNIKDQNEFLMLLLRTHCERKQSRHIHDTEENRHEFLNQVLGGNTIFMKAKRSLTSSFDHLLKRKGSHQDGLPSKESANRKSDSTINDFSSHDDCHRSYLTVGPADGEIMKREISKQMNGRMQNLKVFQAVKRNSLETNVLRKTVSLQETSEPIYTDDGNSSDGVFCTETGDEADASKTPLMNIFLKVGSGSKMSPQDNAIQEEARQTPSGSWRQAIFNRVVTPGKADEAEGRRSRKRTKEELKDLWKTAINQQILLIRMEKENAQLRARQEEATVKRIKLEYDELGNFIKEQMGIWDIITNKDNRISPRCDSQLLLQAVRQGIPRARRGDVWYYFANQYCLKQSPFDSSSYPNYDVPYEDLLKQLTSFQHTILIDLGRTFPNHPYFSSPLGPGQLALFNLLKAYSLLDPQVGYCQGLSFVAGVLLLHLSEDQAFLLLRHLMFRRNLRKQYLPDMAALQVQLYQISRLLHDSLPKLYVHFDKNEIAPTLYAASWMLTLFASQFPLGFVTRVFDLIFIEQTTDIILRVIMALFEEHNATLLKLSSFEEIMDYLKHDIPKMDSAFVDKLMKKVLSMDISKQLHEYEVEYHVLQEEISTPRAELDRLRKVDVDNKKLMNENMALQEQLEILTKNVNRLEKFRSTQQGTIQKLETKVKTLEMTVKFLGNFIAETREKHKEIEVPGEIRRIIANLELASDEGTFVKPKNPFEKSAFFRRIHSTTDCYERPDINEFCSIKDLPNGTKYGDRSNETKGSDKKEWTTPTGASSTANSGPIRGVSLRVIADDEKYEPQPASNFTSKITYGVSSLFNSSTGNTVKNDQNSQKTYGTENPKKTLENEGSNNSPTKHNFSGDIGSLHLRETALRCEKKENTSKKTNSNYDNVPSASVEVKSTESTIDSHHLHPLDCSDGVSITFNGTTKLKSIKSGHHLVKNHSIDLIPLNINLHISEEGDP